MTLNPDQFNEALNIVKRTRSELIGGEDLRTVFKAANIRSWPIEDPPSMFREYGIEDYGVISQNETLNTAQNYLHAPTLRKYIKGNVPEKHPDYGNADYLPEVLETVRGSKWIDEGHHRIVASRLRGDPDIKVYQGYVL